MREETTNTQNGFGISTAHRLASEVGRGVLTSGGNAFDAAVAAAVTLAVVEPGNSGVGGEGYCIFYDAAEQKTGALCFMGEPCALATPENVHGKELVRDVLAPMVPAAVPGWFALLSEKCTRSAEQLFAPAIDFARGGFLLGDEVGALNWHVEQGIFHSSARKIFVRSGRPWQKGDRLRQPDLAQTLEGLAKEGPEFLYTGEIAERIDTFFQEAGGLLRARDLAAYQVRWQEALAANFNDIAVHVPPPESTGFSVLLGLKLLEAVEIWKMSQDGLDFAGAILNVLSQIDKHITALSSQFSPYDCQVMEEIGRFLEEDNILRMANNLTRRGGAIPTPRKGCHTTSLSVADRYGNLVCLTQTLDHGFGSGVVVPGTGVLLNNGMAWVKTDLTGNSANLVGPRKHFFVPVVPTISLTTSGHPFLSLGTPGGYGIPQTTLQVLAHILFGGDDVQTAFNRPRIISGAPAPGVELDVGFGLEKGFSQEVYDSLSVNPMPTDWELGNFHAVQFWEDGSVAAFADSRGEGVSIMGEGV